jgi:hypothetical protein
MIKGASGNRYIRERGHLLSCVLVLKSGGRRGCINEAISKTTTRDLVLTALSTSPDSMNREESTTLPILRLIGLRLAEGRRINLPEPLGISG